MDNKSLFFYEEEAFEKGCLVIDFSFFCPDVGKDETVHAELMINGEKMSDTALVRRFGNSNYIGLSKDYGEYWCPMGYPIILPLNGKSEMMRISVSLAIDDQEEEVEFILPVIVQLTPDKPFAKLNIRFMDDEQSPSGTSLIIDSKGDLNAPKTERRVWAPAYSSYIRAMENSEEDEVSYTEIRFTEEADENRIAMISEDIIVPVPVNIVEGLKW